MPRLKDTSWRVLCVVVRQTLGWQDASGLRKERDWLTRSQFKVRTGRNSEAITQAIDMLVRQGYITAQNSKGLSLQTPQERRQNHGRIYYGLTEYWQQRIGLKEHRKNEQLPVLAGTIFHEYGRKTKHVTDGKANMTKETETKEINNHTEQVILGDVSSFIKNFQSYAQECGIKQPDISISPDTVDRLNCWLEKTCKEDQVMALQKYFCSDLFYIVQRGYSLHAFVNICNILPLIGRGK